MKIQRIMAKNSHVPNEALLTDINVQSSNRTDRAASMTGIWQYAVSMGIPFSVVMIVKRYTTFGIVGASGVIVDMAVLFLLADPRMLHLNLSLGKVLAAEIAILSNFIWNELWTFRDLAMTDPSLCGRTTRFAKFNLICLAGIGISVLLLNIQTRFFDVNMYVGNLIAIVIVSFWNFGMNQKFGWKNARL